MVAPVVVRSATETVYSELLKAILSGKFQRGSLLRQKELAAQLGVSRTPLREALMRLASIGLVNIESNRGARVAELDFGNMRQAWESRIIVESGAARVAARGSDLKMLEKMQKIIARQSEVKDDIQESLLINREFHLSLVAASKNPYLIQFSEILWGLELAAPIFGRQAIAKDEMEKWASEHQGILDAIIKGDGILAADLTVKHITNYPPL